MRPAAAQESILTTTCAPWGTPDAVIRCDFDPSEPGPQIATYNVSGLAWHMSLDGSRAVSVSFSSDGPTFFVLDAAGEVLSNEGPAPGFNGPRISPDGSRFAYFEGSGPQRMFIREIETDSTWMVAEGVDRIEGWSPDGTQLMYVDTQDALYRVDVDGPGEPEQIRALGTDDASADWSYDGSRIAVVSYLNDVYTVITIAPDGSDPTTVAQFGAAGYRSGIEWSPDGEQLAVVSVQDTGGDFSNVEIDLVSVDDGSRSTLVSGNQFDTPGQPFVFFLTQWFRQGIVVNTTGDEPDLAPGDGSCDSNASAAGPQCTLRAAIQEVNAADGDREIEFDLEGEAPFLISPTSPLPTLTDGVILDATTQAGWVDNPLVRIDGSGAGGGSTGLVVDGDNVVVKGLMITGFGSHGIHVAGGSGALLETLIVGSDTAGSDGLGNGGDGIHISGGTDITIGSEPAASKSGTGSINIGGVFVLGNVLNGLYAANESNAALIRSDVHTVEIREGTAKGGSSAARAISLNLNVNNLIVGTLDQLEVPVGRPNGENGICFRGVSDATLDRVRVSDATMNGFEITASQRIQLRRFIAGLREPEPTAGGHIGRIGGDIIKVVESLDINVGSDSASDEPVQGVAAEGWFMRAEDSEDVQVRNVLAGVVSRIDELSADLRPQLSNQSGGIYIKDILRPLIGKVGVPTVLANNGGNSAEPEAGLMAVGELTESFRAVNLHLGTTPDGMPDIGNHGSGMILADGIRDAFLGGDNPLEQIVSAGNMGYGFLFRDLPSAGASKDGKPINFISATRLVSDMLKRPDGELAEIPNVLSGLCMLRASAIKMNMFSVGPSGRHGIETIDSNDLQFLSGSIGSMFEEMVDSPADLMGPTENGVSIDGGSNISLGGVGGIGGNITEVVNLVINDVGGRGVSAVGTQQFTLANTGIGAPLSGWDPSPQALAKLGSTFEAVRLESALTAQLMNLHLMGNGSGSPDGVGALFARESRDIQLMRSLLGDIDEGGAPERPNAGTAIKSIFNDDLLLGMNRIVGHLKGVDVENSTVTLNGNRLELQGAGGGPGEALRQIGGAAEAIHNTFVRNTGPAAVFSEMESAVLKFNNFVENAFGVQVEDAETGNGPFGTGASGAAGKSSAPGIVFAPDNWWGDPSGPGGTGSGSGDAISDGVIADTWLSNAAGIMVRPDTYVVEADPGEVLVIPVRFASLLLEEDELDVTVSDERGWVSSETEFAVQVAGSSGSSRDLEVTVGGEETNRITIRAVSMAEPARVGEAVILVTEPDGTVPLETAIDAGIDELDADADDVFTIGDEIIINPGGANEESAVIAGFGSILLEAPLRFPHLAGEIITRANTRMVDREAAPGDTVPATWEMEVYPNPARMELRVLFNAPHSADGRVELFDVLGRRVAIVNDGSVPAGRRQMTVDVANLTPGVYVVRGLVGHHEFTATVTVVQ